jgi:hypothetical protein
MTKSSRVLARPGPDAGTGRTTPKPSSAQLLPNGLYPLFVLFLVGLS